MKTASDYSRHAQDCRALAAAMKIGEQRDQLLRMAEMWEQVSKDRAAPIRGRQGLDEAQDRDAADQSASRPQP
jgi:hypothetical protein